jgi:hypothetical protein
VAAGRGTHVHILKLALVEDAEQREASGRLEQEMHCCLRRQAAAGGGGRR